ncbi:hypothetical protein AALP_AA7G082100 [Arabis alpina]|uniref:AP2/ERF domain-containing protein n=1 Tax=Arabis alpina TaxID=50452 RepID=A0A087GGP8_ARAAL|nr:hypothetical protein AALP_AA7G082100 [Arabis alpina]
MAARAHDVAAIALRGRSACLNFADSAWRLRIPESSCAKDIQKAAAEAAVAFQAEMSDITTDDYLDITQSETETTVEDDVVSDQSDFFHMNDENIFGMPRLLANMAEGMLLPPPSVQWNHNYDGEGDADFSLWSYSM